MKITAGYGKTTQSAEIDDSFRLTVLSQNTIKAGRPEAEEIEYALDNPIAADRLENLAKGRHRVIIITSDITRPMPTARVLPHVLARLETAGVKDCEITLVFALGSHRHHTEDEKRQLAGEEAFRRICCADSDPEDTVHMGITPSGTPVDITRVVAEADFRIALGNIEYHYFAGYSGGAKALMPGVSTPAAIAANHRMMTEEGACAGRLEGNPVRMDIEASERLCPIDFILNVVLDEDKNIVKAVAGDVTAAHRQGCAFLDTLYSCPIEEQADIVIATQGGAPKDLNLYQTQKALDNARHAVKPGGIIILCGECPEGLGNKVFEAWMKEASRPEDLTERVRKDFRLGGHKAAAIASVLEKADVYLVSSMDPQLVKECFLKPFDSLEEAYKAAVSALYEKTKDSAGYCENDGETNAQKQAAGKAPLSVIFMPHAGSTLPALR